MTRRAFSVLLVLMVNKKAAAEFFEISLLGLLCQENVLFGLDAC